LETALSASGDDLTLLRTWPPCTALKDPWLLLLKTNEHSMFNHRILRAATIRLNKMAKIIIYNLDWKTTRKMKTLRPWIPG
jgi:hypothetical protein